MLRAYSSGIGNHFRPNGKNFIVAVGPLRHGNKLFRGQITRFRDGDYGGQPIIGSEHRITLVIFEIDNINYLFQFRQFPGTGCWYDVRGLYRSDRTYGTGISCVGLPVDCCQHSVEFGQSRLWRDAVADFFRSVGGFRGGRFFCA